jgi:hypothetical protein
MMTVAIVTPFYRAQLTPDEEISLTHLRRHLGSYDKFLVSPQGLRASLPGFGVKRFGDRYFRNAKTYSALLINREFYQAFSDYEYILIYQLDALVFSDQLPAWCREGYDYIGAPWFPCAYTPHITAPKVGNGGFSLRKVESCLRVLEAPALGRTYWVDPDEYWDAFRAAAPLHKRIANLPRKYLKRWYAFNSPKRAISRALKNSDVIIEDEFWSNRAPSIDPSFSVAPVDAALRFSFEAEPRMCFRMTGNVLPFGCHAWDRTDREFWEPYLETGSPVRDPSCAV